MSTAVATAAQALALVPVAGRSPAADRRHEGPGWFDSSWDLRAGLQVDEGWPGELGVCGWIEAWLQLVGGGGAGLSLSAM